MELKIFSKSENTGKKTGTPIINISSHGSIVLNKFFCQATGLQENQKATIAQDKEKNWYLVIGHEDSFSLHPKRNDKSLAFSNAIIAQAFMQTFQSRTIDVLNGQADMRVIRSVACDIDTQKREVADSNFCLYKINTSKQGSKVNFKK